MVVGGVDAAAVGGGRDDGDAVGDAAAQPGDGALRGGGVAAEAGPVSADGDGHVGDRRARPGVPPQRKRVAAAVQLSLDVSG